MVVDENSSKVLAKHIIITNIRKTNSKLKLVLKKIKSLRAIIHSLDSTYLKNIP